MAFKKGRKKTGGRQKGTANKATAEFKKVVEAFAIDNFAEFIELLNDVELPTRDKLHFYTKLFDYVLPKQSALQLDTSDKIEALKIEIKPTGVKPLMEEN